MSDLDIDWQIYYEAAKKCHELAADLRTADKPLHDAVKGQCAGMAGDAPGCKEWGLAYDRVARDTMQTCTNLADALTNFGYVLYAVGYNYGLSDATKDNSAPPRPDVREVSEYRVALPSSVSDTGKGIDHHSGPRELYNKLVEEIEKAFGKLPNGDTNKLGTAHTTWDTFANHQHISGASARITAISGLFDNIKDKTGLPLLLGHLDTLRQGADQVASASQNMASPVGEYHTGTVDVRKGIESAIAAAAIAAGLALAFGIATSWFSFGSTVALAFGEIAIIVGDTVATIRTAYQASKLIKVVAVTIAAAGVTVAAITAFDKVPDLGSTITALAGIIAMRVYLDDDDDNPSGSGGGTTPGTSKPEFRPNSAHQPGQPGFNPRKTIEPSDSKEAYEKAIQGSDGKWYGVGSDGEIYRYSPDNNGGAHFSGKTDYEGNLGPNDNKLKPQNIPIEVRRAFGKGAK